MALDNIAPSGHTDIHERSEGFLVESDCGKKHMKLMTIILSAVLVISTVKPANRTGTIAHAGCGSPGLMSRYIEVAANVTPIAANTADATQNKTACPERVKRSSFSGD